jgi:hypothetical protein
MATTPPVLTPFSGDAPQRGDRSTFSARVDAFVTWLIASIAQFAAIASNVYANAQDAFTSASNAASAATAALTTANVSVWTSGTTYQQYAAVISRVNGYTYRRLTAAGSGAVDPSTDPTNWGSPQAVGFSNMVVIRTTQTWTPPAGITRAKITVVDGGYSGGTTMAGSGYGGAGRGGNASISVINVSSSVAYTSTVGAGGSAPASGTTSSPVAGGASSFSGSGITTLTSSSGTLLAPGAAGPASPSGQPLGGGTLVSPGGTTTGIGVGGAGAPSGVSGNPGQIGAVIIEY